MPFLFEGGHVPVLAEDEGEDQWGGVKEVVSVHLVESAWVFSV
jgi:hypothetical protein